MTLGFAAPSVLFSSYTMEGVEEGIYQSLRPSF